ncbi:MAG: hypothetical protein NTW11_01850 [Candidatus Staskawiczbacteria bacterium]|nr:hypothetical protein [Candidatus Staskawiczbacteria bacterium]
MDHILVGGGYHAVGTPVKICFEGKVTRGTLAGSDNAKDLLGVRTSDGKVHWSHKTHVSLDRPEPPPRRMRGLTV